MGLGRIWGRTGIMQGRFTDKGGFYPQQFPWDTWEKEFCIAGENGLGCIEWMFNAEFFENNPIWTYRGRQAIFSIMANTGVKVKSICANYFMKHALITPSSMNILEQLLNFGEELGVEHIVIPLFDSSAIAGDSELIEIYESISECLSGKAIKVCFESDLPIDKQIELCEKTQSDNIGICYDVGNAAGNGYDCMEDINKAKNYLFEIHYKDKVPESVSVMLGTGSVDFPGVLHEIENCNCLRIFESWFGRDAIADTQKNIDFIRRINEYD